jgi:hypothetical protein
MRIGTDHVECALCGERLSIHPDVVMQVMVAVSGGQPPVRVLRVDGIEIHRCLDTDPVTGPALSATRR